MKPLCCNIRQRAAQSGSALVIVLLLLALVTVELGVLGMVVTQGLGDEGILVSQNIVAKKATDVALNRIQERLRQHLQTHHPNQVMSDFGQRHSQAIHEEALTALNPETGATDETGVMISAWVVEQRGHFYHLVGQAQMGRINLSAHRWIRIHSPTTDAAL